MKTKKYLIIIICVLAAFNIIFLITTYSNKKLLRALSFSSSTQQNKINELQDQFSRITVNYMGLSNFPLESPIIIEHRKGPTLVFRLLNNSCEMCTAQSLDAISKLTPNIQRNIVVVSDKLNREMLKSIYNFDLGSMNIMMAEDLPTDHLFQGTKSYFFVYNNKAMSKSFVAEYDLPELLNDYLNNVSKGIATE